MGKSLLKMYTFSWLEDRHAQPSLFIHLHMAMAFLAGRDWESEQVCFNRGKRGRKKRKGREGMGEGRVWDAQRERH